MEDLKVKNKSLAWKQNGNHEKGFAKKLIAISIMAISAAAIFPASCNAGNKIIRLNHQEGALHLMEEKKVSDIDPNFKQKTEIGSSLIYFDAAKAPIVLEGLPFLNEDGRRSRLPRKTAEKMVTRRVGPAMQTAGGLVRFRTDSPEIAVRVHLDEYYTGFNKQLSTGFDLYTGCAPEMKFLGNHCIENPVDRYEFSWKIKSDDIQDYSIYLPVFCSFFKIEIGIKEGCRLESPTPRRHRKGIAIYGSSITNCGSAGRPGMLYPAIIGRMLDIETINIGISGNCFGEICVADPIATLDLAVFILQYDSNAPTPEFLRKTHEPFFKYFRKLRPDLPILMFSKPYADFSDPAIQERRAIIVRTWLNAFESGDRLVEFLDGETFFAGAAREDCSQDCVHQNDLGERLMAECIADRLKRMIKD